MPATIKHIYFCEKCGRSFGNRKPSDVATHERQVQSRALPGVCHGRIVRVQCTTEPLPAPPV